MRLSECRTCTWRIIIVLWTFGAAAYLAACSNYQTERIRKLPHTTKPCPDAGSLVLGQNQECLGGESEQASFHTLLMQAFVLCVFIGPT